MYGLKSASLCSSSVEIPDDCEGASATGDSRWLHVDSDYNTVLNHGAFSPPVVVFCGVGCAPSGGSRANPGLPYALMFSPRGDKLRTEIRNLDTNRRPEDGERVRRSEITPVRRPIPNDAVVWDALQIKPAPFSRPASMLKAEGGVIWQVKETGHGSPILAVRRTSDDRLRITTRNQNDPGNGKTRYLEPWSVGVAHDFVRRFKLSPTHGELDVWLDGKHIISLKGISMGYSDVGATAFSKLGCYFPRGLGPDPASTSVCEFSHYVPPQCKSLFYRVNEPPLWPMSSI